MKPGGGGGGGRPGTAGGDSDDDDDEKPPAAGGGAGGGLGGGLLNPSALGHWGTAAHPKGADGMAAATLGEMLMQEHTKRQRLDG